MSDKKFFCLETVLKLRLRRFWGLFWLPFESQFEVNMLCADMDLKLGFERKLKRTPKSTEAKFENSLLKTIHKSTEASFVVSLLFLSLMTIVTSQIEAMPFKLFKEPQYEIAVEALLVQRRGVKKFDLVVDQTQANQNCGCFDGTVMTTTQVVNDFDWEPGVKASFSYVPNDDRALEVSLAWINDWNGERVENTGSLSYPFDLSFHTQDYTHASRAEAHCESHLWDGEINYWAQYSARGADYFSFSAIIGARGFYLGEHFKLTYTTPPDTSTYWTMTKNRILGLQLGGNLQWNPVRHWSWELTAKGGMMGDWSWADTWLGDVNNTAVLSSTKGDKLGCTYLLDGDVHLFYHHNQMSIALGYRLLGLYGVALAPNQLSTFSSKMSSDHVNDGGRAYYHIISFGFYFLF
jgi:hypothetical protein